MIVILRGRQPEAGRQAWLVLLHFNKVRHPRWHCDLEILNRPPAIWPLVRCLWVIHFFNVVSVARNPAVAALIFLNLKSPRMLFPAESNSQSHNKFDLISQRSLCESVTVRDWSFTFSLLPKYVPWPWVGPLLCLWLWPWPWPVTLKPPWDRAIFLVLYISPTSSPCEPLLPRALQLWILQDFAIKPCIMSGWFYHHQLALWLTTAILIQFSAQIFCCWIRALCKVGCTWTNILLILFQKKLVSVQKLGE